MSTPVYVLGGYQTDFARNWNKEGKDFADAFGEPGDEDSARFDLDGNGRVDLFDFFIFADSFGATVHFLDDTNG